jgi:type I restriction enzyme S subunit
LKLRYSINEFDGFYISTEKNNFLERSQLELHDVLFTTIGKYLGVAGVVNENLVGANINQNVVRIRLKENVVTPQYLACFLNSKVARFQIDNLFTGNTHPILTYPKIKSLKIFVKSNEIETLITKNLLKADEYHNNSINMISKAKKIFIKSLNIDFSNIKERVFYKIKYSKVMAENSMVPIFYYPLYTNAILALRRKKHVILGNVANCKKGDEVGSANYKLYLEREEGDIPFIRTTDFVNYDVDLYPDFFIDENIANSFEQDLQSKDILYTNDGKIGLVAMVTDQDNCVIQSHINRIRCYGINPYYLFIALITKEIGIYQAKRYTVVQTTIPTIRNSLEDFIIPISNKQEEIISLTQEAFKLKQKRKILVDESRLLIEKSLE